MGQSSAGTKVSEALMSKVQRGLDDVQRIDFETDVDSTGEPAVWVWIVLREDAPETAWSWDNRERIRRHVVDRLRESGVSDWVYIRFRSADEDTPAAEAMKHH